MEYMAYSTFSIGIYSTKTNIISKMFKTEENLNSNLLIMCVL